MYYKHRRSNGKRKRATTLCDPEPNTLREIAGDALRPDLGVQGRLASEDVHLVGLDERGTLEYLPEDKEGEEDGDTEVGYQEVIDNPIAIGEHMPAVENDDDAEKDHSEPGNIGLERGLEVQAVARNALGLETGVETNVTNTNGNPGEKLSDGGEVVEPVEDSLGAGGHGHVSQEREGGSDTNTPVRNTALGALKEDLGCLTVLSKSEEITRAAEQESVG